MPLGMRKEEIKRHPKSGCLDFNSGRNVKYFQPVIKRAILAVVGRFPVRKELPSAEG